MEIETTKAKEQDAKSSRWILWVVGLLAVAVAAIIWFARRGGHFVIGTVNYVVDTLSRGSGLSPDLVRGLVILLTIPFFWAVAKYVHSTFFFHLRPSLKLYTNRYGLLIVAYVAMFFLARYAAFRHQLYTKWCAETAEGLRVYDQPGKDPIYGIELTPCTPDQIVAIRMANSTTIITPHQIDIYRAADVILFEGPTRRPMVWYYLTSDGGYDLFDAPGFHPIFGEKLKPVTTDVAGRIHDWIGSRRKAMLANGAGATLQGSPLLKRAPAALPGSAARSANELGRSKRESVGTASLPVDVPPKSSGTEGKMISGSRPDADTEGVVPTVINHTITTGGQRYSQCTEPTASYSLGVRDSGATSWVEFSTLRAGDVVRWDFVDPTGTVDTRRALKSKTGMSPCTWSTLEIAGRQPFRTGTWQVRVFWNGVSLFTDSFDIR